MTEAKHTPGPWIRPTCALHMLEHIKSPREDRRQYGVKCLIELYAERKDLLAALKDARELLVAQMNNAGRNDRTAEYKLLAMWIGRIDAAIAKAGQ